MVILLQKWRRRWPMNSGKTIFAQLMDFLPAYEFRKCVEQYDGHYKIKPNKIYFLHKKTHPKGQLFGITRERETTLLKTQ